MAIEKLKNPYNSFEEITRKINEIIDEGGTTFQPTEQQLAAMNSGITSTKTEQIETNKNNIQTLNLDKTSKIEIENMLKNIIYPVGHIIVNNGTDPTTYIAETTWELYATGTKALYLDSVAGTIVNEELPNIKGKIEEVNFRGSSAQLITKTGAFSKTTKSNGNSIGCGSPNGDVIKYIEFNASDSSAVYKDNGTVKAEGITVCAWVRTA